MGIFGRLFHGAAGAASHAQEMQFIIPKDVSWRVEDIHALENAGDFEEALRRWTILLAVFSDPELPPEFQQLPSHRLIQMHVGTCHRQLGHLDEALRAYERAATLAQQSSDPVIAAKVAGSTGIVYRLKKDYRRALTQYEEALAMAVRLNDWDLMVTTHDNMSFCYQEMNDWELAYSSTFKAANLMLQKPSLVSPVVQARVLANQAALAARKGQNAEARRYLGEALAKAREAGNRPQEAVVMERLSQLP